MSRKQYPTVVLVGRTNVGKSTLFNRLSTHVRSIVFDAPGVTRDFIKDLVSWQGRSFELVDTGGVSFSKTEDIILQEVRARALACIETAYLVLFVCDGSVGLLPEDREIAKLLHKKGVRVALVVNKMDTKRAREYESDFLKLGFKTTLLISALHSRGVVDILEAIVDQIPDPIELPEAEKSCKVVLLGKPNVGKSSLLNLLLKQERAIVSNIPGTTREPISEHIRFYQEDILLTDTAGVRRKRSVEEPLELLMAKSTLQAVKHADIVLLMVDSSQGCLADQELKLAFYVFDAQHKGLILLFNKQDLLAQDDYAKIMLEQGVKEYQFLLKKTEQLSISCKDGQNIGKILPLVQKVSERYQRTFSDEELTVLFNSALEKKPLYKQEERLIVFNAKQVKSGPITIILYVNNPPWFGQSQLTFFENQLREYASLKGVPVVFIVRKKGLEKR